MHVSKPLLANDAGNDLAGMFRDHHDKAIDLLPSRSDQVMVALVGRIEFAYDEP